MPSLHVAIDCRVVDPHFPGIGRATLETARGIAGAGLARHLSLIVNAGSVPADLTPLAAHGGVDLIEAAARLRSPADQWALPRLLRTLKPDVFHATYYALPIAVPGRLVVTIYDLIPQLFPAYWSNRITHTVITTWTSFAARRATRIIACSASTANDIGRLLRGTRGKVRVVPLGVAPVASPPSRTPPDDPPYLLYVGSNKPHKNLPRLVAAFARIAPRVDGNLVIAGAWDVRHNDAIEMARRHGLGERVIFEHRPSDARLADLRLRATGFVFPSLYEGFGLPVLEAMAAGIPVATTDRGSLGEVAGDAALLFDPIAEESMAAALERLLTDQLLQKRLRTAGLAQAARFPWSRTAHETWAVYEEAACA